MTVIERRVALVTGGTRSIGAAISQRLVRDGIEVVAVYRRDDDAAEAMQKRLSADGIDWFRARKLDVSDPQRTSEFVASVLERHGRIDYLVHAAAVLRDARLRDMRVDDWDEVIRVDLSAAFYVAQPVLRAMVERGFGRIAMIGSVGGFMGTMWQANYAAAKAGLWGLVRSIARDGARHGVTANLVVLGSTESDMTDGVPESRVRDIVAGIPVQRLGRREEVANAVRFLLDDLSGFVTGSALTIDGGMSMG